MQILSWEDLQLTDLKCLLIPQEIFFMLNCSFEFIQQLSEVQGELEWAPQTTGKTEIKGHLQTELSSGSMSARPLSRATFTGSVTRTDTQSLTQNTGVSFRGGCRDRVGYERREHTENIGLNSLVVSVTPTEAARERKEKSARSLILPWFREFVPVPVRQLNNSAGNLVNKSRTQNPNPLIQTHS